MGRSLSLCLSLSIALNYWLSVEGSREANLKLALKVHLPMQGAIVGCEPAQKKENVVANATERERRDL